MRILRSKDELLQFIKSNPEESFKQMMGVVRSDVEDNSSSRAVDGRHELCSRRRKKLGIWQLKKNKYCPH